MPSTSEPARKDRTVGAGLAVLPGGTNEKVWRLAPWTLPLLAAFMLSSAFSELFRNQWLWGAILLSLLLQFLVIYTSFLQHAFGTVGLSFMDWLLCTVVASSVLWLRAASKLLGRFIRDDNDLGERE